MGKSYANYGISEFGRTLRDFKELLNFSLNLKLRLLAISLLMACAACFFKPEPPDEWKDRFIVYKSLASDTGYAGYYVSFHEKKFLTFRQFLSTIPGNKNWREEENVWVLSLEKFDMDITDNGPIEMFFREEISPSGNRNVLLFKVVTQDYEIPWVMLDQIVMKAGEMMSNL
ncbi:MAG: hypothetical protein NPINA01_27720 [Nitrospinaceae bacterium]|nr:MAG: hypothetical protein NPINA01_27720 [Nitrospinaceae bacterium]